MPYNVFVGEVCCFQFIPLVLVRIASPTATNPAGPTVPLTDPSTGPANPSTTPLLGQVTDKEYCQAKKPNNRFNVPLGTKFYRVRVKPWKPILSPSLN